MGSTLNLKKYLVTKYPILNNLDKKYLESGFSTIVKYKQKIQPLKVKIVMFYHKGSQ